MNEEVLERIFKVNLGVNDTERVLVFADLIAPFERVDDETRAKRERLPEIAKALSDIGRKFCSTRYIEFNATGSHGKEPPRALWVEAFGEAATEKLEEAGVFDRLIDKTATHGDVTEAGRIVREYGSSPEAVIALTNYSTSHTRFRDLLTSCMSVRYASMPMFEESMLDGVMTADWKEVEARTLRLAEMMNGADTVVITSHNGTSITFSMKGREVQTDTGIITEPGSFSNLPAGEAFLAPVEGTAEGMLVLEWAPTRKLHRSIELVVKKGVVVEVVGDDPYAGELRGILAGEELFGNIAELGIGTNDKATRPDNILETEKILGTVHIALGDNSSFGGKVSVPFHQDFIFFAPNLEVLKGEERVELLIEGEPRF